MEARSASCRHYARGGLLGLGDRLWSETPGGLDSVGGRWSFALWALVVPVYAVSVAVFFVSSRYRLPLLVPLAAGAGFALVRMGAAARARATRRLAAYAIALLPLFALAFWPHGLDDGRSEERTVMLLWLVDNGRGEEALQRLPQPEAGHADLAKLLLELGQAALEQRQADLALRFVDKGIADAPRLAALREKRGLALVMLERPGEARAELEEARRLDPASGSAALKLAVLEAQEGRLDAARALAREALDVSTASPFYRFIETLFHNGVTGGCGGSNYCPSNSTTRQQMAVFVLRSKEGAGYTAPACAAPDLFSDVPSTSPFCSWIEELFNRGVVAGCGPNLYCPTNPVTREQMAVFVLRTRDPTLNPPACTTPMFADVPASSPFCRWIEELARRGVVTGCAGGNYCPTNPVTREQMGVFISVTFGLTLYGL